MDLACRSVDLILGTWLVLNFRRSPPSELISVLDHSLHLFVCEKRLSHHPALNFPDFPFFFGDLTFLRFLRHWITPRTVLLTEQ